MFELMRIGHKFEAPQGIVLGGTNPGLDFATAPTLRRALEGLKKVYFSDSLGVHQVVDVLGVEVSTSIGEKLNIHLLISSNELPDIEEGAIIYCEDIPALNDLAPLTVRQAILLQ
jgi:hypothetical protein